ncbi:NAD-dependent epimerase/dehydratase family protein [Streptosporangium lutulentum]
MDRLLADEHEVMVVDDLSGGDRANLADAARSPRFALHVTDVRDPALIGLAAEWKPEVICHLAAQISVRKSVDDPVHDARINVEGTASVLTAAHHGGTRKVVFASSVAVYGRPSVIPVPSDAATDPRSPYAASKLGAETYLATFKALYGIDYTTLVLSNVYGPRQSPDGEAGVVAIFTDALLKGTPTVVYGDGGQTRDYIFVDDVVNGFVRACGDQEADAASTWAPAWRPPTGGCTPSWPRRRAPPTSRPPPRHAWATCPRWPWTRPPHSKGSAGVRRRIWPPASRPRWSGPGVVWRFVRPRSPGSASRGNPRRRSPCLRAGVSCDPRRPGGSGRTSIPAVVASVFRP